jgi:hypothetical protein
LKPAGHVGEQRAEAVVEVVDAARGTTVAQRRPDGEVDSETDRDADGRVGQPRKQHRALIAVAREQHDERGGGGGGRLRSHRTDRAERKCRQQHERQ